MQLVDPRCPTVTVNTWRCERNKSVKLDVRPSLLAGSVVLSDSYRSSPDVDARRRGNGFLLTSEVVLRESVSAFNVIL